ncbi:hypothetical protein [Sinomonas gamaensis]|uniref:hypothetical protein n=1 Tax=Sinomonas gamaensis TaxID=2565624 RepID=UPI0011098907|nr:hypothetical protein [Sinomonas gamaensis]
MTRTPDPRAEDVSTNAYCSQLMKQRYSHEAQGLILLLPRTGLMVVPFAQNQHSWDAVVVEGSETYPRGGHHIAVGNAEIETALELPLIPHETVNTPEEAEALPDGESILTPGSCIYGKNDRWDEPGVTYWLRTNHTPIRTDMLSRDMHFPARVLGTAKAGSRV